jgi:RND family efflux transporter MFP subunit
MRPALRPAPIVAAPILAAVLLPAGTSACTHKSNAFAPPPPPKVTVAHPVQKEVTHYLEYTGTIEAHQVVDLRARVPGFLDKVLFKPGAKVKKDDLLFVIDKRTYEAAVKHAEAQLESDRAALQGAEADAKIAEELASQRAGSEIDRIIKLARRDSAKAAIAAAQAEVDRTRLDLEFCEVRAPLEGRITKNFVDAGNLVGQGLPTLLATLVESRPMYVSVDISESDLLTLRRARMQKDPSLEPGQIAPGEWRPVDLAIADRGEFSFHGHVDYVDPLLNAQTSTIRVRCRFENEDEFLLPGLFVRLRFPTATGTAVLAPDTALLSDQAGRYALVVDEHDEVQVHRVSVGELDGSLRVVSSGLTTGDRLVVNGLLRARPGAKVQAQMEEPAGRASPAEAKDAQARDK